jgi:hypothetical protein
LGGGSDVTALTDQFLIVDEEKVRDGRASYVFGENDGPETE